MTNLAEADDKQLAELKAWFFKENIRINEAKEALNRERSFMERERALLEKQLEILKDELFKLADEKRALEIEKKNIQNMRARAEKVNFNPKNGTMFFNGVRSELALRKRYKDLIKIYHPDNLNGDTDTIQCINKEFDSLKKRYCG